MITSTSGNQVKKLMLLQKKARARREAGQFVVEGPRMVIEVPKERLVQVYMSESFYNSASDFIQRLAQSQEMDISTINQLIEIVADNVYCKISETQTPQGVMAIVKMQSVDISQMLSGNPLLILIENLQDPGNLGTILRMGEGAGVSGIIMSSNTVDIYNPKTIRSTMGSIYRVPFIYADDFHETLKLCRQRGVCLFAAHLQGKNTYLGESYKKPTGFLIGNEGNGLTEATTAMADTLIRIPMEGQVESLNAAIACTILTYEAVRQRGE